MFCCHDQVGGHGDLESATDSHAVDCCDDRFAALRQGAGQPSRDIDGSSRALFFVSLVNQIVLPWGAILLLGALGTERDAGQFGVAYRLAMLVNFAYLAVESILGPRLAVLCAGNDMAAVQDLAGRGTTVVWIIALPLACLLLLLPEVALAWFGADFVAAAPVLLILVGGQCANVLTGSVQQLLVMSNYVQDFRNVCIASGAANVLLGIIFIPSLGAIGAAVAVAGAIAVQNVAAVYFVWHRLGFIPLPVIFGRRS